LIDHYFGTQFTEDRHALVALVAVHREEYNILRGAGP
jgi:hypothetical protein